jgi:hypothetical protein
MTLSTEVADLMRGRHAEAVWLTVLEPGQANTFDAVARHAGLVPTGRTWSELDREAAAAFLTSLLHRSLAYHSELMPAHRAAWLAAQFINSVGTYDARFATNTEGVLGESGFSWDPATEFTLDAGIVAVGSAGSALYWVGEED